MDTNKTSISRPNTIASECASEINKNIQRSTIGQVVQNDDEAPRPSMAPTAPTSNCRPSNGSLDVFTNAASHTNNTQSGRPITNTGETRSSFPGTSDRSASIKGSGEERTAGAVTSGAPSTSGGGAHKESRKRPASLRLERADAGEDSSSDTANDDYSLGSEDGCIYTYRGGEHLADLPSSFFSLDMGLPRAPPPRAFAPPPAARDGDASSPDMDFLEMDFDPGASCEADTGDESAPDAAPPAPPPPPPPRTPSPAPAPAPHVSWRSARTADAQASAIDTDSDEEYAKECRSPGASAPGPSPTETGPSHNVAGPSHNVAGPSHAAHILMARTLPLEDTCIHETNDISIGSSCRAGGGAGVAGAAGARAGGAVVAVRIVLDTLGVHVSDERIEAAVGAGAAAAEGAGAAAAEGVGLARWLAGAAGAAACGGGGGPAAAIAAAGAPRVLARFFPTHPERAVAPAAWLAEWLALGAAALLTLHAPGAPPAAQWSHRAVLAAAAGGVTLAAPAERVCAGALRRRLAAPPEVAVEAAVLAARLRAGGELAALAGAPAAWRRLNVLGQAAHAARALAAGRDAAPLRLPADAAAGVTLAARAGSAAARRLLAAPELPPLPPPQPPQPPARPRR